MIREGDMIAVEGGFIDVSDNLYLYISIYSVGQA
jgi:hypothetical protein